MKVSQFLDRKTTIEFANVSIIKGPKRLRVLTTADNHLKIKSSFLNVKIA